MRLILEPKFGNDPMMFLLVTFNMTLPTVFSLIILNSCLLSLEKGREILFKNNCFNVLFDVVAARKNFREPECTDATMKTLIDLLVLLTSGGTVQKVLPF